MKGILGRERDFNERHVVRTHEGIMESAKNMKAIAEKRSEIIRGAIDGLNKLADLYDPHKEINEHNDEQWRIATEGHNDMSFER